MIGLELREATAADVEAMQECRRGDPDAEPADPRMKAYFAGEHHPRHALLPRTGYVAIVEDAVIGYIAGHLTTRHGTEGEVQYLYVAPAYRRRGVGTALLGRLMAWFEAHAARRICVAWPMTARPRRGRFTNVQARRRCGSTGTGGKT